MTETVHKKSLKKRVKRAAKAASFIARGLASSKRVVLAQIVPMRRCDLACTYCNERDDVSKPVPLYEVKQWIDKLAEFKTMNITISGGEPMLHPEIYEIIRYIRSKGIMAGLITNGRALTDKNIQRLNGAGLQDLQVSVDNVDPDEVSGKSLSFYESKGILESLARFARFDVNLNSVIGSELEHPEDAWQITQRAAELGFGSTVGIIHDGEGLIKELKGKEKEIYDQIIEVSAKSRLQFGYYSNKFQSELLEKGISPWKCRAGARYLYICEHGRVQWCSQRRVCKDDKKHGAPISNGFMLDVPLKDYSWEEFDRQYYTEKWCAPKCTIQCVRLVGLFDKLRGPQTSFEKYVEASS